MNLDQNSASSFNLLRFPAIGLEYLQRIFRKFETRRLFSKHLS